MITAVVSIRIQHREKTKKKKKEKRKKKANIKSARGFLSSYACCSSHPSRRLFITLFVYMYTNSILLSRNSKHFICICIYKVSAASRKQNKIQRTMKRISCLSFAAKNKGKERSKEKKRYYAFAIYYPRSTLLAPLINVWRSLNDHDCIVSIVSEFYPRYIYYYIKRAITLST